MEISAEKKKEMLWSMMLSRRFEEKLTELCRIEGKIPGMVIPANPGIRKSGRLQIQNSPGGYRGDAMPPRAVDPGDYSCGMKATSAAFSFLFYEIMAARRFV